MAGAEGLEPQERFWRPGYVTITTCPCQTGNENSIPLWHRNVKQIENYYGNGFENVSPTNLLVAKRLSQRVLCKNVFAAVSHYSLD